MFPSHLPTPRRPAAQSILHPALGHYRSWLDRRALCALIENLQPAAGGGGGFRSQAKADRVAAEWDPRLTAGGGDAGASGY